MQDRSGIAHDGYILTITWLWKRNLK